MKLFSEFGKFVEEKFRITTSSVEAHEVKSNVFSDILKISKNFENVFSKFSTHLH